MKNGRILALCFILSLIFVVQRSWSENVDTNAAYMTAFGRPATASEISFWQNRLPATQAELVQISLNWLVSARGAGELTNVVNRGFQEAFSRQPTAAEQQEWQTKIKTEKMTYTAFVASLKGKPNSKLQILKIPKNYRYTPPPASKTEIPPAFPLKTTAPVVIACPENVRLKVGVEVYSLSRKIARFTQGLIQCSYSPSQNIQIVQPGGCPATLGVEVMGPDMNLTTSMSYGCKPGFAFCHRPTGFSGQLVTEQTGTCTYNSEGVVKLEHETTLTCQGSADGKIAVAAGYTANGKFLCW